MTAYDPKQTTVKKKEPDLAFLQIAIVVLGLIFIVMGYWNGLYLSVGVGLLVGFFAVKGLLMLKGGD